MSLKNWAIASCVGILSTGTLLGCSGITHSMDSKVDSKGNNHAGMGHSKMEGMEHSSMEHSSTEKPMGEAEHKMKEGHGHGGMHHGSLAIPEGQPVPVVELSVEPDSMKGWNLQAAVSNFEFAPERVNQSSVTTEGHAHLFINGEKITRLYAPWYYIPDLPSGEHEIRVELNANGHEALMDGEQAIADTVSITVP